MRKVKYRENKKTLQQNKPIIRPQAQPLFLAQPIIWLHLFPSPAPRSSLPLASGGERKPRRR